jgi:hypothetical protein
VSREGKRQQRRARIDARREKYRGKRQDLIAERAARREETSDQSSSWPDVGELIAIFIMGILSNF